MSQHVSRYNCRAITGLHWYVMGGIIRYRTLEEPIDIMLHSQTNRCHAIKGIGINIVFHELMPCQFLIKNKDYLFYL